MRNGFEVWHSNQMMVYWTSPHKIKVGTKRACFASILSGVGKHPLSPLDSKQKIHWAFLSFSSLSHYYPPHNWDQKYELTLQKGATAAKGKGAKAAKASAAPAVCALLSHLQALGFDVTWFTSNIKLIHSSGRYRSCHWSCGQRPTCSSCTWLFSPSSHNSATTHSTIPHISHIRAYNSLYLLTTS